MKSILVPLNTGKNSNFHLSVGMPAKTYLPPFGGEIILHLFWISKFTCIPSKISKIETKGKKYNKVVGGPCLQPSQTKETSESESLRFPNSFMII